MNETRRTYPLRHRLRCGAFWAEGFGRANVEQHSFLELAVGPGDDSRDSEVAGDGRDHHRRQRILPDGDDDAIDSIKTMLLEFFSIGNVQDNGVIDLPGDARHQITVAIDGDHFGAISVQLERQRPAEDAKAYHCDSHQTSFARKGGSPQNPLALTTSERRSCNFWRASARADSER